MVSPHIRVTPVAVIAGLLIMIATLLYAAFNRNHPVAPEVPPAAHQLK
jgi:hypothetical protein